MSDTSFSKAGWFMTIIFFIFVFFVWLWEQTPVIIRRSEYKRLRDNDLVMEDAHRIIRENQQKNAKTLTDLT